MADLPDHLAQAEHNETLANRLLSTAYPDWAITAAFYSAVHLAEACFTTVEIGHSETACRNHQYHDFREITIKELAANAFRDYKKLRRASYELRYLTTDKTRGKLLSFYPVATVEDLVRTSLPNVRIELGKAFGIRLS